MTYIVAGPDVARSPQKSSGALRIHAGHAECNVYGCCDPFSIDMMAPNLQEDPAGSSHYFLRVLPCKELIRT